MGDSSSLKEKGSSRFRFDERMKKVFNELYVSHNGGEFKDVIKNESRGNNFDREHQWKSFTEAFNAECKLKSPNKATKQTLQRYFGRLQNKIAKAMSESDDPAMRYR
jgi:hypothetical protein